MKKTAVFIFKKIQTQLFSEELKHEYKVSEKHFTRNRKQNFPFILLFMLNFLRKSLKMEIDNFISFLKPNIGSKFTKIAFVQARMKVKPEVFKKLSQTLIDKFYTDNDKAIKL